VWIPRPCCFARDSASAEALPAGSNPVTSPALSRQVERVAPFAHTGVQGAAGLAPFEHRDKPRIGSRVERRGIAGEEAVPIVAFEFLAPALNQFEAACDLTRADAFTVQTRLVALQYRFHRSPLSVGQGKPPFAEFRIDVEPKRLPRNASVNQ